MLCTRSGAWRLRASKPWNLVRCRRDTRAFTQTRLQRNVSDELDVNNTGRERTPKKVSAGIVTTDQPKSTTVEQLLSKIASCEPAGLRLNDTPDLPALVVLLFTQGLSHLAQDVNTPIRLIESLTSVADDSTPKSFEAVSAVIDRLPVQKKPGQGQEGIGYMIVSDGANLLEPLSGKLLKDSAQKPGSLVLKLRKCRKQFRNYEFQLPLAHTIFSTGLASTMVRSRYTLDSSSSKLEVEDSQKLESQTLTLPWSTGIQRVNMRSPLVLLTPPRIVHNSMGNIIRTVSSALAVEETKMSQLTAANAEVASESVVAKSSRKAKNKQATKATKSETTDVTRAQEDTVRPMFQRSESQPASSELESAVSAYFEARNLSPEPVEVWALILPITPMLLAHPSNVAPDLAELLAITPETVRSQWTYDSGSPPSALGSSGVLRALFAGGRLCKVLSGGGGWGKKAGLLSLDPDTEYSGRDLRSDEGWEFDFSDESESGIETQQRKALGEIVREGESVAFFIAPKQRATEHQTEDTNDKPQKQLIFGSIPSSIDILPSENSATSSEGGEPNLKAYPARFGILSEGGMALKIRTESKSITETKFDVPYGTIQLG